MGYSLLLNFSLSGIVLLNVFARKNSFYSFFVSLVLGGAYLLFGKKSLDKSNNSPTAVFTPAATSQAKPTFSLKEVAKHSQKGDCWLVIEDKVYDLSSFTNHPGGDIYLQYCGGEATSAFQTKAGRGQPHSTEAKNRLKNFYLGDLNREN